MDEPIAFRIVRLGYDRAQVDDEISRLVAEHDRALSLAEAPDAHRDTPADGSPESGHTSDYFAGFHLVRRGYDRAQVDDEISRLVAERDRARAAALGPAGGEPT